MNYFQNNQSTIQRAMSRMLEDMAVKRKIFVSFHHANDQRYFDRFDQVFCQYGDVFHNRSLGNDFVDSYNHDYVHRVIREKYIKGSSITIVLCGAETQKRKFVDWEIHSTLDQEGALLGIALPTASKVFDGVVHRTIVPDRLHANIQSGYAHFIDWTDDYQSLKLEAEKAIEMSRNKSLIINSAQKFNINVP